MTPQIGEAMRCVIVLGGDYGALGFEPRSDDFVIACDSGYRHLAALGLQAHILLGDMDSLDMGLPAEVSTRVFPVIKDETDCILAIDEGIRRGCGEFALLCGFGGRVDHIIGNLQSLAYLDQKGYPASLHGDRDFARIITARAVRETYIAGMSLSVFAYGSEARGVYLRGVKYPLEDATLSPNFPLGVSNYIEAQEAEVSVREGRLLIMRSIL